jgi:transcriptional regulator with XRE-family HTH domain
MIQGDIAMRSEHSYNFKAIGQAIKKARESKRWTREQSAQVADLAPHHIMSFKNKEPYPSFQVFHELVTIFDISVDQFFYPDKKQKSMQHRQFESPPDDISKKELRIVTAALNDQLFLPFN